VCELTMAFILNSLLLVSMIVLVMSIGVMRMGMGMRLMSVAMGVLHSRLIGSS
jgi:hypothetical protein